MAVELTLKKWGNSLGVVVPAELIERKNLKEGEKILVEVVKKADLRDVFGIIKKRKMSGQDAKNLARKGWN